MMNLLINYALIYVNLLTKCNFNYEGHGTSQLDDGFWLAGEYTLLHTHPRLMPRMSME